MIPFRLCCICCLSIWISNKTVYRNCFHCLSFSPRRYMRRRKLCENIYECYLSETSCLNSNGEQSSIYNVYHTPKAVSSGGSIHHEFYPMIVVVGEKTYNFFWPNEAQNQRNTFRRVKSFFFCIAYKMLWNRSIL